MNDKLKQAIGKLKDIREVAKTYGVVTISEVDSRAIDTVVEWAENPKFTPSQVIEMFVVAKSMTEHLDEKGRNEYFDRIINSIGKE